MHSSHIYETEYLILKLPVIKYWKSETEKYEQTEYFSDKILKTRTENVEILISTLKNATKKETTESIYIYVHSDVFQ